MKYLKYFSQFGAQHPESFVKNLPALVDTTKTVVYQRFNDLNKWYKNVTGLDKVQECQERVTELQVTLS